MLESIECSLKVGGFASGEENSQDPISSDLS